MLHTPFPAVTVVLAVLRIGIAALIKAVVIFMAHEIGKTVVPVPGVLAGNFGPLLVITGLTTNIEHPVDAGAATQSLAAGVDEGSAVQARIGLGTETPVCSRIVDAVQVAHRDMNPVVVIPSASLDQ